MGNKGMSEGEEGTADSDVQDQKPADKTSRTKISNNDEGMKTYENESAKEKQTRPKDETEKELTEIKRKIEEFLEKDDKSNTMNFDMAKNDDDNESNERENDGSYKSKFAEDMKLP